jgi:uncharacterized protein (TIGR00730 family)
VKTGRKKAYENMEFIRSRDARALRILSEYLEPAARFEHHGVDDTIVFMGSSRIVSRDQAQTDMERARDGGRDLAHAEQRLLMSKYYEAARELAHRFTVWSKQLPDDHRRFVVCTGGGPGIMEAANRGAVEANGTSVGLSISLPHMEQSNAYTSRDLAFEFHYFFMRKFWFVYLAKAVILFPGGFGTLDELFEILTLRQTGKLRKHLPLVLFGREYWESVVDFDALVRHGSIRAEDLKLFLMTDSPDEVFRHVTGELTLYGLQKPGATL